jgi:hypothetical protein
MSDPPPAPGFATALLPKPRAGKLLRAGGRGKAATTTFKLLGRPRDQYGNGGAALWLKPHQIVHFTEQNHV